MAITIRDKNGTYGKERRASGPRLDRCTARYFAVVDNSWSKGFETRREAEATEREMKHCDPTSEPIWRCSTTPIDLLFVVKSAFGLRDQLSVACVGVGS